MTKHNYMKKKGDLNEGFRGGLGNKRASIVKFNWPFRNAAGNWGEFQILTNR